ncbi:hypothetical protein HDU92_001559 [Lobulomyces angularis]|nr:hypothetical protein HDU92_001559 [Lobulomyces angularis]
MTDALSEDVLTIFVFDRKVLHSSSGMEVHHYHKFEVEPQVDSSVLMKWNSFSNISKIPMSQCLNHITSYFKSHVSYAKTVASGAKTNVTICERLIAEQKVQIEALKVALNNLAGHSRSLCESFDVFEPFALKELARNSLLLQTFPRDLETLRQIQIHPSIINKEPVNQDTSAALKHPNESYYLTKDETSKSLIDFVPETSIKIWADNCKIKHDQFVQTFTLVSSAIKKIKSQTDEEINVPQTFNLANIDSLIPTAKLLLSELESTCKLVERDVDYSRIVSFVQKALNFSSNQECFDESKLIAMEELAQIHENQYLIDIQKWDDSIRESVCIITEAQTKLTENLVSRLQNVSELETAIAQNNPIYNSIASQSFGSLSQAFSQLLHVHRMAPAWGASLIEIVRRKEFSKIFMQKAKNMAEVLAKFRAHEEKRRRNFTSEISRYIPNGLIHGLDGKPPFCEVSITNSNESLPNLTSNEIFAFEKEISEIRTKIENDNLSMGKVISVTNNDSITKLQATMTTISAQLESISIDFDRILFRSGLSEKFSNLEEENLRLKSEYASARHSVPVTSPALHRKASNVKPMEFENATPSKQDEVLKIYEARIKNLEKILQDNYIKNSASSQVKVCEEAISLKEKNSSLEKKLFELQQQLENITILCKREAEDCRDIDELESWKKRTQESELRELGLRTQMEALKKIQPLIDETKNVKTLIGDVEDFSKLHHLVHLFALNLQVNCSSSFSDPHTSSDVENTRNSVTFSTFLEDVEEISQKSGKSELFEPFILLASACKQHYQSTRQLLEEMESKLENRNKEFEAADNRVKRLELELRHDFSEKEDHKTEIDTLNGKIERLTTELKSSQLEKNFSQNEIALLRSKLETYKVNYENVEFKLSDLNQSYEEATKNLGNKLFDAEAKLRFEQNENSKLQGILKEEKSKSSILEALLHKKDEELKILQLRITNELETSSNAIKLLNFNLDNNFDVKECKKKLDAQQKIFEKLIKDVEFSTEKLETVNCKYLELEKKFIVKETQILKFSELIQQNNETPFTDSLSDPDRVTPTTSLEFSVIGNEKSFSGKVCCSTDQLPVNSTVFNSKEFEVLKREIELLKEQIESWFLICKRNFDILVMFIEFLKNCTSEINSLSSAIFDEDPNFKSKFDDMNFFFKNNDKIENFEQDLLFLPETHNRLRNSFIRVLNLGNENTFKELAEYNMSFLKKFKNHFLDNKNNLEDKISIQNLKVGDTALFFPSSHDSNDDVLKPNVLVWISFNFGEVLYLDNDDGNCLTDAADSFLLLKISEIKRSILKNEGDNPFGLKNADQEYQKCRGIPYGQKHLLRNYIPNVKCKHNNDFLDISVKNCQKQKKIAIDCFNVGDLALFLPARNQKGLKIFNCVSINFNLRLLCI